MWPAPRIQPELHPLGYTAADLTLAEYAARHRPLPSQTWRTFPDNRVLDIAAIDLFVVATAHFHSVHCFTVLRHDRHRVVRFNLIAHSTARWTGRRIAGAFPYDEAPRFLIRDRDGTYGQDSQERLRNMNIEKLVIAHPSAWQDPYCERRSAQFVGSV